jgi:hypothetical protein
MPRQHTPPPRSSELETWLSEFCDELRRLRPHVTDKLANVVGRAEYLPGRDPRKAAAAYHSRQTAAPRKGRW